MLASPLSNDIYAYVQTGNEADHRDIVFFSFLFDELYMHFIGDEAPNTLCYFVRGWPYLYKSQFCFFAFLLFLLL